CFMIGFDPFHACGIIIAYFKVGFGSSICAIYIAIQIEIVEQLEWIIKAMQGWPGKYTALYNIHQGGSHILLFTLSLKAMQRKVI
ncbi:hypothetical protein RhiTH_007400, partial [Rhizoctonia solani]